MCGKVLEHFEDPHLLGVAAGDGEAKAARLGAQNAHLQLAQHGAGLGQLLGFRKHRCRLKNREQISTRACITNDGMGGRGWQGLGELGKQLGVDVDIARVGVVVESVACGLVDVLARSRAHDWIDGGSRAAAMVRHRALVRCAHIEVAAEQGYKRVHAGRGATNSM